MRHYLFAQILIWFMIHSITMTAQGSETFTMPDDLKKQSYESAIRVADWMVRNQVSDPYDANYGRLMVTYDVKQKKVGRYAPNWMQGVSIMGLLMTYHRTGDKKYLEAAERAGQYIKDLQILDNRKPEYYGAFREDTAHSPWCHPRDALTGALGLLWLYEEKKDPEYLERIKLFNKWFFEQAMAKGWPLWTYHFDGRPHIYLQGSFHGGDGVYFYDYWRITGDESCLEKGLKFIVDYTYDKFLLADGKIRVIYDAEKGEYLEDGKTQAGMQIMHRHNDDFMSISFLDAYIKFGYKKYLDRAEAYAKWLMSEQREDGGFGKPDVPPAAPVGSNFLLELYKITKKPEYIQSAIKGAKYLLTQQETDQSDMKAYGGFYGYGNNWSSETKDTLNLRTSAYALIFLLKIEGKESGPYYSPFDRDSKLPKNKE